MLLTLVIYHNINVHVHGRGNTKEILQTQIWNWLINNYIPHYIAVLKLKEYYEIVGESRPLSEFFRTHADFFTEMHL